MSKKNVRILFTRCFVTLATLLLAVSLSGKEFILVIDPGHGGNDPGAVGKIAKEKTINLSVALKLGRLIEQNCKDVKVIYTRKTDKFIPLNRRAEIANEAKADLFISIHTNAVAKGRTVRGAETFTLGLARSEANLELAKRENSVILIEEDYQQRYEGFNPNSSESYIIFEFIQDKHMEQSVKLAKMVQEQFKSHAKRIDRGVHQAGFLVLRSTTMPSVLVELGYISTPEEERYLSSKEGIDKLAASIYKAFLNYKKEHQTPETSVPLQPASPTPKPNQQKEGVIEPNNTDKPVFKIQILTSPNQLAENDKRFKGLSPVEYYKEKGLFKYTYKASTDYNEVLRARKQLLPKFKDAFIIAFKNGKKMDNVQEAINEFKKERK